MEILKNVLSSVPIRGKFYYCVMIDISKIKNIWSTLEACIQTINDIYSETENVPELIIICGKYDLFKNYGKYNEQLRTIFTNVFRPE